MIEALDLSTAQGERIRVLNVAYAEKMMLARKEAMESDDRATMRETMRIMRKE